MAKGSKRAREAAERLKAKAQQAKAGGESKYHKKKMLVAKGDLLPSSPFFLNPEDPTAESVEDARTRELSQRSNRQYVHYQGDD